MNRVKYVLAVCFITVAGSFCAFASDTKVACIGDSLTYGTGIKDKVSHSYPSRLQQKLGEGYEVRNFGLPSASAEHDSVLPYNESDEYKAALEYNADVYVLMLGTNDAKGINWKGAETFKRDYEEMIDEVGKGRIILMDVPPTNYDDTVELTEEYTTDERVNEINTIIDDIAREYKIKLIKNHDTIAMLDDTVLIHNDVHLNERGAGIIAEEAATVIRAKYKKD